MEQGRGMGSFRKCPEVQLGEGRGAGMESGLKASCCTPWGPTQGAQVPLGHPSLATQSTRPAGNEACAGPWPRSPSMAEGPSWADGPSLFLGGVRNPRPWEEG